jgi:hypothetical protein
MVKSTDSHMNFYQFNSQSYYKHIYTTNAQTRFVLKTPLFPLRYGKLRIVFDTFYAALVLEN